MPNKRRQRPTFSIEIPAGGWAAPWPKCLELAQAFDSSKWNLVGSLMVQLHAVIAIVPVNCLATDVDLVLHVENL